jgi:glycosyltransferase involved in cell wall biosynthesis
MSQINPSVRIALVLIAKNEERCLERCLRSVAPWVDEMIVLDTGSTDGTINIARTCGSRVFQFDWIDDFSAARNVALSHSDADWNLILDADEWIVSGGDSLRASVLGPPSFIGVVNVASSFGTPEGSSTSVNWISRLLPRGIRYAGRIHEQPVSALPRKRLPVTVGHDGYDPASLALKRGRNAALLMAGLAEKPEDSYLLFQLGKDCEVYQQFSQACAYYGRAWEHKKPQASYLHSLVIRWLYCMGRNGQLETAIALATEEMENWQHSPDFFFVMGNLLLDLAVLQPERASTELLPMIEACWERCLEIGEAPLLEDSVAGRGSYLAEHNLSVVRGTSNSRAQ